MAALVDSSVWIAAAKPRNPECIKLRRMIQQGERICLVRAIQVEVCQGARTEEQFHSLWEKLLGFEFLEITDRIWGRSAYGYFRARKKGLTLTTLDCLIATIAAENAVPLWTLDRGLLRAQGILGFEPYENQTL